MVEEGEGEGVVGWVDWVGVLLGDWGCGLVCCFIVEGQLV